VPTTFEDALAAQDPTTTPLAEAYDFVREHLPKADNLGGSGDERDFYTHLDRLSEGVSKTFPESFCRKGCSACCHYPVALFNITLTEWNVMRRHMETAWTDDERAEFVARFRKTFKGFWLLLFSYLQQSALMLTMTARPVWSRKIACPFLKDDACSIYAARPYQCRTFGHFSARQWPFKQPKVYACSDQGENLLALLRRAGPQFQLPVMNPIIIKLRKLCSGPRMSLPLWVAGWVRQYKG
jgi:Fe-S-cluster containining protein